MASVAVGLTLCALVTPAAAQTVLTRTIQADPGSLGVIGDGPAGGACATAPVGRSVTFTMDQGGPVVGVAVSFGFVPTHRSVGELTVTLVAPDGQAHVLFARPGAVSPGCGSVADVTGPYTFADTARANFFATAMTSAGTVIPAGSYRSVSAGAKGLPGVTTSLDAAFVGRPARGTWRLVVSDGASGNTGGIAAASLTVTVASTTSANASMLGMLPARNCDGPTPPPPSREVTFDVSGPTGPLVSVGVTMALKVTYIVSLKAELISPDGATHMLFPGYSIPASSTSTTARLNGTYDFSDRAAASFTDVFVLGPTATLPSGSYGTVTAGYSEASMDPVFAGRSPNGTWTLRLTSCVASSDAITAAALSLVTSVASAADTFTVEAPGTLVVPAPGVLANDSGPGRLTASLASIPTHGSVTFASDGSVTYVPAPGFVGQDRFEYRVSSAGSVGLPAVVTIDVNPPRSRAPANIEVVNVTGNHAVLRWEPPAVGATPTAYELTAGTTPGQVLARVLLPPDPPVFGVDAPPGVFFVRLTTQSASGPSAPSADARLSVGVADPPSPPVSLTGLVNGDILTLHWKDTFAGGAPTGAVLDVSGAFIGSLPIGGGGGFTFPGVPAGTYTFALRARNGAGASGPSNPVRLTFPGACSGPPATPTRLLAYTRGGVLGVLWDPPPAGPAPERYDLHVSGSFTGTLAMGLTRALAAPAPSGTYTFTVTATNACGTSAPTASAVTTVP